MEADTAATSSSKTRNGSMLLSVVDSQREIVLDRIEDNALALLSSIFTSQSLADDPIEGQLAGKASLNTKSGDPADAQRAVTFPSQRVSQTRCQAQAFKVMEHAYEAARHKTFVTKRDLFYRDVALFGRQATSDAHIDSLCSAFGVDREVLGFRAAAKGLVIGSFELSMRSSDTSRAIESIVCKMMGSASTQHLIPSMYDVEKIETDAEWVLIVEKEAVFQLLRQHELASGSPYRLRPGLIITGKGYPDRATQQFLVMLADRLKTCPFFIVTDGDPYGLDIMRTYRCGNGSLDEPGQLALERIHWLGVRTIDFVPSKASAFGLTTPASLLGGTLPLTAGDRRKAAALLSSNAITEEIKDELRLMLDSGCKAEMEVMCEPFIRDCNTLPAEWPRCQTSRQDIVVDGATGKDDGKPSQPLPVGSDSRFISYIVERMKAADPRICCE